MNKVIVLGLIFIVIVFGGLYFLGGGVNGNGVHTEENFEQFKAMELEDKCATPSYTTDEEWKEHMGHHPEMYKGCL